jgi:ABC-type transport system substrate-binding protein
MGDPRTLRNTINAAGGSGSVPGLDAVEDLVSVGLAIMNDHGRLEPRLGEAVPTLENGLWTLFADGRMQTIWKIRPGAVWHDGTPVTGEDFVLTARIGQDRELPIASRWSCGR